MEIRTEAEYLALDRQFIKEVAAGDREATADGEYLRFDLGAGSEAWCHLDAQGRSAGFVPYFAASRPNRVRLDSRVASPASPLDGAFIALALDGAGGGLFPFVFEVPDFRTHDRFSLPVTASVALAGFAHSVAIYRDESALRASGSTMAAKSFIPSGMFRPGGAPIEPPQAYALMNGVVAAAEERTNRLTDRMFRCLAIDTYGMSLEVVVDPDLLPATPEPGSIAQLSCWLTGRPLRSDG
ncbi:MAG: hypothetical protein ABI725_05190 [Chloroflexota bacterium]